MNTLEFPLPENTQLPRPPQRGSSAHTRATLDAIPLRISCYPQVVMSPTNPDKPPLIVFRGDADKWSDARNTIELYLRALDPPLIGYVRVSDYDGTQTFPLEDGTVHPLIREPQTPVAPPSTTGSAGGDGLDDDPDMSESERKRRKKERKKARQLALDPIGVSLTVSREMSKVSFIIQQCMDENIRLLIYGKKPYDAWKLLNDRYGTAEAVDHMRLLRELNALKLKVGDDPGIFVAKLDAVLDRYEQATGMIHGDMGRSLMLREKLPREWDSLVQSWHGQHNVIPYQQLRGLVERQKVTPTITTSNKETALAAVIGDTPAPHKSARGCFNCRQPGHDAVNCPELNDQQKAERREKVERWRAENQTKKDAKAKNQKNPPSKTVTMSQAKLDALVRDAVSKAAVEIEQRLRRNDRHGNDDSSGRREHRGDGDRKRDFGQGHRGRSPQRRGRSHSRGRSRSPRREHRHGNWRQGSEKRYGSPRRSRSPDRRSSFSLSRQSDNTQRALFAHALSSPPGNRPSHWRNDPPMGHVSPFRDNLQNDGGHYGRGNRMPNTYSDHVQPPNAQSKDLSRYGPSEARRAHTDMRRDCQSPGRFDNYAGGNRSPSHRQRDWRNSAQAYGDGYTDRERRDRGRDTHGAVSRQWEDEPGDRDRSRAPPPRHDNRPQKGSDSKRRYKSPGPAQQRVRPATKSETKPLVKNGSQSAKKPKLTKDERKIAELRQSFLDDERNKNLGLEIRGRKPTDAEIKQHGLRRMAFTDLEESDDDEVVDLIGSPPTETIIENKPVESRERISVTDYKELAEQKLSMADVLTPSASPVIGMGDVSGMKTPTMGSPVVDEKPTTPIQDQADGDRSPSATSEKSLMAIASAGIDQLTANNEWIVDSGATAHMAKDMAHFVSYRPTSGSVECGATTHRSIGTGTVRLVIQDVDGREQAMYLTDVIHVPEFKYNLLSLRKAVRKDNMKIEFDEDDCLITHKEKGYSAFAPVSDQMGLYVLPELGAKDIRDVPQ